MGGTPHSGRSSSKTMTASMCEPDTTLFFPPVTLLSSALSISISSMVFSTLINPLTLLLMKLLLGLNVFSRLRKPVTVVLWIPKSPEILLFVLIELLGLLNPNRVLGKSMFVLLDCTLLCLRLLGRLRRSWPPLISAVKRQLRIRTIYESKLL